MVENDNMPASPLVSVIMPTYNQADFIGESIDSVIYQTYVNWELIIIDNYSTDNTEQIVEQYRLADSRVKYCKFANQGVIAASRNLGMRQAKGDLVAFLDSDDLWLETKLEKQVEFMGKNKDVFLLYSRCFIKEENKELTVLPQKFKRGDIFKELFLSHNIIDCLTVLMRNKKDQDKYFFNETKELITVEDYALWLRIAYKHKIDFINEPLAIYRIHAGNNSGKLFFFFKRYLSVIKEFSSLVSISLLLRKYVLYGIKFIEMYLRVIIGWLLRLLKLRKSVKLKVETNTEDMYRSNQYFNNNPSLHQEDVSWKIGKIIPMLDKIVASGNNKEINVLDVGGGTGEILSGVVSYLRNKYKVKVNKFILDLSPAILEEQRKNNPDVKQAFNENILKTSLKDKQIDIAFMIDTIEHIDEPQNALKELKRIAKYIIFKVPLENNLANKIMNVLKRGKLKKFSREALGHINVFKFKQLKKLVLENCGELIEFNFTNVFNYVLTEPYYYDKMSFCHRLLNCLGVMTYTISPRLGAVIFSDFVMLLVQTYPLQDLAVREEEKDGKKRESCTGCL